MSLPVLDVWRAAVEGELKRRDWGRSDLARAVGHGVTPTAITQILDGQYKTSSLVRPICETFGWPLPMPALTNEHLAEWAILGFRLYEEKLPMFESLLATARAALGK